MRRDGWAHTASRVMMKAFMSTEIICLPGMLPGCTGVACCMLTKGWYAENGGASSNGKGLGGMLLLEDIDGRVKEFDEK